MRIVLHWLGRRFAGDWCQCENYDSFYPAVWLTTLGFILMTFADEPQSLCRLLSNDNNGSFVLRLSTEHKSMACMEGNENA
jgi:hypothetical protein